MKKVLFMLVTLLILSTATTSGQVYYQVFQVYDTNLNELSSNSQNYKIYMNTPIMINIAGNGVYIWLGYAPAGCYSYPICGQDNSGNYVYAQQDLYGNAMMYNMMGQPDYIVITPDMSVIRHALAFNGCIVDARQITSEDYFALTSQYTNQNNSYGSGSYGGGGYTGNDYDYNTNNSRTSSYVEETCSFCHGSGDSPVKEYAPNYTGEQPAQKYCSVCKAYADPHYHKKCPSCGGKGYNLKRKY